MLVKHGKDPARRGGGLLRRVPHARQKKIKPGLPVALGPDSVQEIVVGYPVLLEEQAEIENRLTKHAGGAQQEGDQQPAEATVAVEERMDRLKLDVCEARLDQQRDVRMVFVQEQFESAHAIEHHLRWRRNKCGIPWTSATDP